MTHIFRGRLVTKNQMTIPVQMQRSLDMEKGDELEFHVEDGNVTHVNILKPVPADLLSRDILSELKRRRAAGIVERELSQDELSELTGEKKKQKKELVRPVAAAF